MAKENKKVYNRPHHRIIYALAKPIARLYLRLFKRWRGLYLPKGAPRFKQYVILSNHNSDFDVVALSCALPGVSHFVASDHILKWKVWGKLISYCCGPIPIARAQLDLKAIKDVLRCKKEGGSVGIFPEGGCSYTGRTGYIAPATAKLVKQLGLPVYLYAIEGNFLMKPCGAKRMRNGRVWNELRATLTAEQVSEMSVDELHECICSALSVDAYKTQREKMYKYKGKGLADELEVSLYKCPKCGQMCCLKGEGEYVTCECGYKVKYNEYGFFEGDEVIFDSITDWDDWQRSEIVRCIEQGEYDMTGEKPIFTDEDEILVISEKAHDARVVGTGTLTMYSDRFELHGEGIDEVWHFSEINKLRATDRTHLSFSTGGDVYIDLRSSRVRSSYKYMLHYNAISCWAKGKPIDYFGV